MADECSYDDLPDGVLVADEHGSVVTLNPAAQRLLGVTADSAVGRDYRAVLPLADEQGRDWWACTDPYAGLATRTRQPERRLALPSGRDLLVTAAVRYGLLVSGTTAAFSAPAADTDTGTVATPTDAGRLLLEEHLSALRWRHGRGRGQLGEHQLGLLALDAQRQADHPSRRLSLPSSDSPVRRFSAVIESASCWASAR